MTRRLAGHRALVTGSTGKIGGAVARALAVAGATVVVTGRDKDRGLTQAGRITAADGAAVFVAADLGGGEPAVAALAAEAADVAGGTIDILVNNAAALVPAQSLFDATEAQIDQVLALNVKVPFLLTAALARHMIEAGGGAVVNIGSVSGVLGMPAAALYGASKAGLHSLTKSFAAELASQGVRVNTVAPGLTVTEANEAYRDGRAALIAAYPDRRAGTAAEVAAAVVFLASDDAAHIHGITLPVDGGLLAVIPGRA
jgi:NAD(P)-dependent dehydrogenase (short-subunit alcohol dehydrogenase family)